MIDKKNGDAGARLSDGELRALHTRVVLRCDDEVVIDATFAQLMVRGHLGRWRETMVLPYGLVFELVRAPDALPTLLHRRGAQQVTPQDRCVLPPLDQQV